MITRVGAANDNDNAQRRTCSFDIAVQNAIRFDEGLRGNKKL